MSQYNIIDALIEFTDKNANDISKSYFNQRGWDDSIIKKWHLGYFPSNKIVELLSILKKHGFDRDDLKQICVLGNNDRSFLFDRVVFPIWDVLGDAIGISGRTLKADVKPKYFNNDFDKGRNLYGMNFAIPAIRKEERVYIFEGYADTITAHKFGIENSVCCMGTALTREHYILLSAYTKNIVIIFDNDAGGYGALASFNKKYKEILHVYEKQNIFTKMAFLDLKDPDEYFKAYGKEKFIKEIKKQIEDASKQNEYKKASPKGYLKYAKKRDV